jgi:NAD(P)H dehydrogenase (quinone)
MRKVTIAIIYHSAAGHTRAVAEHMANSMRDERADVLLLSVDKEDALEQLHKADTIVFGCPTYFGNESAAFKVFMERTAHFWYKQLWRDKLAAGFTNSSTMNGDKLHTLMSISLFAAQHGMVWISQGIVPRYINDHQTDGQNRMGSFLGLMTQSDNSIKEVSPLHPGDSLTIELFARRIVDITVSFRASQTHELATIASN